jgi:hypothetical protein
MFITKMPTLNWFATAMPRLSMTLQNGSANVDAASILKKGGILLDNSESSKADTVEIAGTRKETNTPMEVKDDVIELARYVNKRNKEIRDSIPKFFPISPEMGLDIMKVDEENERQKALAARGDAIKTKMLCGKQPTSEEMDFLKENFPDLYFKAIRIEREMEQFRKQLKNCDIKEEKLRLVMEKRKQVLGALQIEPGYVLCMLAAIDEEVKNL